MVRECIFIKKDMIEWIEKSDKNWRQYYQPLMLRLVTVLCLIHLNFGSCLDMIHDLLGRKFITELLPGEFYDALRRRRKHFKCENVLAEALNKIDNTLVIASFGADCSRLYCLDAIFVDMTANQCKDDVLRKWFPDPTCQQDVDTSTPSGSKAKNQTKGKNKKNKTKESRK